MSHSCRHLKFARPMLTARQVRILLMMASGMRPWQIAQRLKRTNKDLCISLVTIYQRIEQRGFLKAGIWADRHRKELEQALKVERPDKRYKGYRDAA